MARINERRSPRERRRDSAEERPAEERPDEERPDEERPDEERPYADRPFPGEYGYEPQRRVDRPWTRRRYEEEHSWRRPSSWYGGAGPYRGVGPKGYVRSDERIREHVCDALTDDPHLNAADIEVEVRDGEVTLSGSVDSRGAKRHAEDLALQASGVRDVQNDLRVAKGPDHP